MIVVRVLTWSAGSLLLVAVVEYLVHRHLMHHHRPFLDKLGLQIVFHGHAIIHHRNGRNDSNVTLPIYTHAVWAFPSIGVVALFDPVGAAILAAAYLGHPLLWTKLHRAIHGLEDNWTKSLWFYDLIAHHHWEHHRRPGKNFGALFIFTDYLFGTASRPACD